MVEEEKSVSVGERCKSICLSVMGNHDLEAWLASEALHAHNICKYWKLFSKHRAIRDAFESLQTLEPPVAGYRARYLANFAIKWDDLIVDDLLCIRSIWGYMLNSYRHLIENIDYVGSQMSTRLRKRCRDGTGNLKFANLWMSSSELKLQAVSWSWYNDPLSSLAGWELEAVWGPRQYGEADA